MTYFIVRDPDSRGDVATTWNYLKGEWCWDLDGDYTKDDGFAYNTKASADARASCLRILNRDRRDHWQNIRVIDRDEFNEMRSR